MSIGDFLSVKKRLWVDQWQTIRLFYPSSRFALIDLSFGLLALFSNPYRTCRKFLQKRGSADIYAYGETPLTTLKQMAEKAQLTSKDRWVELGAGRGKGCFWIAHFVGCQTVGVEWVPSFVRKARWLKAFFRMKGLSFELKAMEEADFSSATVVYLYGTCLSEEVISLLAKKMEALPKGARVISISYPIESPSLVVKQTFEVSYPWGDTIAYLSTCN
jgi:hypothetical protein